LIQNELIKDYNTSMQGKMNVIKLLRIAAILLLVYVVLLAAIDYFLHFPSPMRWSMYLFDTGITLFLFGLTFWPRIQKHLGNLFLPIVIILVSALPTILDQIVMRHIFSGPVPSPEATLFRVVPFLLMALILVAWQYRWQHIVFFTAVIGLINAGIVWIYEPATKGGLSSGLFAVLTQVFAFLVVGLFIGFMVSWQHKQQRSLEEANAKLTNYAQTLEDLAISKERSRIAQELHDTLSHTMSGLSVQLETMKAYWDVDPKTARNIMEKSLSAARSGLEETRRVLIALRAKPLEDIGLLAAVHELVSAAAKHPDIKVESKIADNLPVVSLNIEQCIYRITQEAISNVLKHSKASLLQVKLSMENAHLVLEVKDNGEGFDTSRYDRNTHFGILGMQERADLVGAKLTIESQPGKGTLVRLMV
jgi:signal transduction histidine kinase